MQFWIWSEAQGTGWRLSNAGGKFVGGYPPSYVGVKELDLPRSYVPRGDTIPALFYSRATHHGAFSDLVRSTGRSLEAEKWIGQGRRGVPPLDGRGGEIGPP